MLVSLNITEDMHELLQRKAYVGCGFELTENSPRCLYTLCFPRQTAIQSASHLDPVLCTL